MSLYAFSVFVHVLAAVVWVGGMLFLGLVAAPVLRKVEPLSLRSQIFLTVGRRFRVVGWICIVLLVATGITNLAILQINPFRNISFLLASPFGHALLAKLVLVLGVILLSALHDFVWGPRAFAGGPGDAQSERYRRRAIAVARLNSLLVLVIVFLGVNLRC